jgi:hypothetical protein
VAVRIITFARLDAADNEHWVEIPVMGKKVKVGFVTTEKGRANRHSYPVRPDQSAPGGTASRPDAQAPVTPPPPQQHPDFAMIEQILERATTFGF